MLKRINCEDPQLREQVMALLNFHLGTIDSLVDKLELSVVSREEEGGAPLYLCRVVASGGRAGRVTVEERQADIKMTVNRALTRITRSLMRRLNHSHAS